MVACFLLMHAYYWRIVGVHRATKQMLMDNRSSMSEQDSRHRSSPFREALSWIKRMGSVVGEQLSSKFSLVTVVERTILSSTARRRRHPRPH